ncbi:MAG: hypothetical protein HYT10_02335 [Candidatus Levybacteria bacterium]|nr:hypothetical protein [Candidatus Levybacteria bacterium]
MDRFILIDGNAILHRAYHALPPLTDKEGNIVNAVYGFFSMLLTVIGEYSPTYLAVCFDRPKPTFRQEMYVGYQQHRPKMSDDLVPQIERVHQVLKQMSIPLFEIDGYEADDLIGTLSVQIPKKDDNLEVLILSGDRDLLQLVNEHVKMLAPIVGVKNIIFYDSVKVKEKFGILPSQIVDYKALVGDSSDGYPGVTGIGPKTASDLLSKYETFENLYKHLGEINPKIAEKLALDAEQASLAKKLATIVKDAPISVDILQCDISCFDRDGTQKAFENLGFKSLLARIPQSLGVKKETSVESEQLGLL